MKTIKIAAVTMGILFVAGCGNKPVNNQTNSEQMPEKQSTQAQEQTSGVIDSVKDAMLSGKEMKCVYKIKTEKEDMEVVTYVNGEKYKTEMTVAGKKQYSLFDGQTMYSWGGVQPQGTKMTKECSQELAKNSPQSAPENQPEDFSTEKNFENAIDVRCEKTSGTDFSVPQNVSFVDQCQMMKDALKNMPQNLPQGMPQNIPQMP